MTDSPTSPDTPTVVQVQIAPADRAMSRADALYDAAVHPLRARELVRAGADDALLARAFNVPESAIAVWLGKYPAFGDAVREGRLPVDVLVEDALLAAALGGGVDLEEDVTVVEDTPMGQTTRTTKRKRIAGGDVGAMKFWLQSRKPDVWKDDEKSQVGVVVHIDNADRNL